MTAFTGVDLRPAIQHLRRVLRVGCIDRQGHGGMKTMCKLNRPTDEMPPSDWPATVVIQCGMGDARNLLMALAGDACIVIGGRAGTISEVCLGLAP